MMHGNCLQMLDFTETRSRCSPQRLRTFETESNVPETHDFLALGTSYYIGKRTCLN